MTAAGRVVFAVLAVASVAAFGVAQVLKSQPPVISQVGVGPVFSPNGDGRLERLPLSFVVAREDRASVRVVDADARVVRTLVDARPTPAGERVRASWDGRRDDGSRAPDGRYRMRIELADEGRNVVFPRSFVLDTAPPRPLVRSVGPERTRGPELLPRPDGRPATASVRLNGWRPGARLLAVRTGVRTEARVVRALDVRVTRRQERGTALRDADGRPERQALAGRVAWDGTIGGRPARAGSYLVQVCVRDRAGNDGCSPPNAGGGRRGRPVADGAGAVDGRGGVTVRRIALQPPLEPVTAGQRARVGVDARGARYRWRLVRVGATRSVRRGSGRGGELRVRVPGDRGGAYVLTVTARGRSARTPVLVRSPRRERVLVVLPAIGWQGANPVDEDGDGWPDVLRDGVPAGVRLERVLAGDGLPRDWSTDVAPVLEALARDGRRYDVTTDLALHRGRGATPADARGLLLLGRHRWTTTRVAAAYRDAVRGGGTLAVLDPDALRRAVEVSASGTRILRPTRRDAVDPFGLDVRGPRALSGPVEASADALDLFRGTDGSLDGFSVGWPIADARGARLLTRGVDAGGGVVLAGARVGRGLVLRPGLPELPLRLGSDDDADALLENTWRRLSR